MIYEATVAYKCLDEKGDEVSKKEQYVIENCNTFSEVESRLFEEGGSLEDFDVTNIKRSKVKETANERQSREDLIWLAEMMDVFHDDQGNEKPMKYKILFFSKTYESANAFITEYSKQGYDMSLVSLKLTKFADVI